MPLLEDPEIDECRIQHPCTNGEVAFIGQTATKEEEETVPDKGNESNIPFDRGWAWMIVLGAFVVNFLVLGTMNASFGILMTEFQGKYGSTSSQVMSIIGLTQTLRSLLGPVAGMLANRISIRKTVMIGGLIMFLGFVLSIFPTQLVYLYFTFGVLLGIGSSLTFMPTLATIGQYFRKRSDLANGLGISGSGVGTFVSAPLIQYLFDSYGSLSCSLLILGGIMLNICAAGALFRPIESYMRPRHVVQKQTNGLHLAVVDSQEINYDICNETNVKSRKKRLDCCHKSGKKCPVLLDVTFLKSALFLVYSASMMLSFPGFLAYIVMIPDHAKRLNIPIQQASFLVSIIGIADVTGRILFGLFSDLNFVQKRFVYVGCTALGGAAICFVSCASDYVGLAVTCAAVGLFGGGYYTLIPVIVAEKFGVENFVSSISIVGFFMGISVLITTSVTGYLKDVTGEWSASFIFGGLLMLVGSALLFLDPVATRCDEKKHSRLCCHKKRDHDSDSL